MEKRTMNKTLVILILSSLLAANSHSGNSEGAALPSATYVVANINAVDEGEHVIRKLDMTLTDKRGKVRQRDTVAYRKYFGDEKRSVLFYQQPSNVKGTGFLTYDYADNAKDDDQWLYLPALRKVRRISASDRGDYFLGTDLTYEDMKLEGKLQPADWAYRVLTEVTRDGAALLQVEGVPHTKAIAK
ncbi:MAG: outer membrane lipoprotein-sorting protein, partial [Halopseudomonas sp.]